MYAGMMRLMYSYHVCLENMALHKTAWQSNPYLNDGLSASLAVDGKKNKTIHMGRGVRCFKQCQNSRVAGRSKWRTQHSSHFYTICPE